MKKPITLLLFTVLLIVTGIIEIPAAAQNLPGIRIQDVEVQDNADSVNLNVYFNVYDPASGQILPDTDVEAAEIALTNGDTYPASVLQPGSPFYVMMLLDTSGSMIGSMPALKDAAVQAVERASDQASFSVMTFNSGPGPATSFNPNPDASIAQIRSATAERDSGTCLYDSLYTAMDIIDDRPAGRRAVLLFTDGVDEKADGTIPCSTSYSYNDIINRARNNTDRVPVYVIGLEGNTTASGRQMDTQRLGQIASETGGVAAFGRAAQLSSLFNQAIDRLNSQWLAQAEVYPSAGPQVAQIVPIFDNEVSGQAASFEFNSPRTYARPFEIFITDIRYDPASDVMVFSFRASGAARAAAVRVSVINETTGITRLSRTFQPLPPNIGTEPAQLAVNGAELVEGTSYLLRMNGIAPNGQDLLAEPVISEFTFDRQRGPVVQPAVRVIGGNLNGDSLQVYLNLLERDSIQQLQLVIENRDTGLTAPPMMRTVADTITVDTGNFTPGTSYALSVYPVVNGTPLTDVEPYEFTMPERPVQLGGFIDHPAGTEEVTLSLDGDNLDRVDSLEISVLNASMGNSTRVYGPDDVLGVPETYTVDTTDLQADREYLVYIEPLGPDGTQVAEAVEVGPFLYDPPRPGILARFIAFVASPLVLGILIALAVIGAFYLRTRGTQKPEKDKPYVPRPTDLIKNLWSQPRNSQPQQSQRNVQMSQPVRRKKDDNGTTMQQPRNPDPDTLRNRNRTTGKVQPKPGTTIYEGNDKHSRTISSRDAPTLTIKKSFTTPSRSHWKCRGRFVVGRSGKGNLNLNKDTHLSRMQFTIYYNPSDRRYYLRDGGANDAGQDGWKGSYFGTWYAFEDGYNRTLRDGKKVPLPRGEVVTIWVDGQGDNRRTSFELDMP